MAEFKQIISDALDILKFDGAVQDTLAELREKWGAQVPALLDERFDAVGVQYMKLSHEKGAAALGQEVWTLGVRSCPPSAGHYITWMQRTSICLS